MILMRKVSHKHKLYTSKWKKDDHEIGSIAPKTKTIHKLHFNKVKVSLAADQK